MCVHWQIQGNLSTHTQSVSYTKHSFWSMKRKNAMSSVHEANGLQGNLTFRLLMVATNILRSFNQSLSKYLNRSGLTLLGLIAFTFSIPSSTGCYLHPPAARLIWHKLHCQYRACTKTGILESSTQSHRGNWFLWNAGKSEGTWPMWPNTCL